jgi:nucleoside-diphosphate-sugar epimerase
MSGGTGPAELVTVLPGAVFGPILTTGTIGSAGIIARMLSGTMRGIPRIGLEIVDVRDLADVHIRAMTSPDAAGQRFLATGEFVWMAEMARVLREGLDCARSLLAHGIA